MVGVGILRHHTQIDHSDLVDVEAAEVVRDSGTQIVGLLRWPTGRQAPQSPRDAPTLLTSTRVFRVRIQPRIEEIVGVAGPYYCAV
jgi:hypothetical protein